MTPERRAWLDELNAGNEVRVISTSGTWGSDYAIPDPTYGRPTPFKRRSETATVTRTTPRFILVRNERFRRSDGEQSPYDHQEDHPKRIEPNE